MENTVEYLMQEGQNRLEQVYINMPEVRFYFSGDREQSAENVAAYLGQERLELQNLQVFSQSGESIYYYVLLDVSASISTEEFRGITGALSGLCRNVRGQDHVIFLTFGEEVKQLFELDGTALLDGSADRFLEELENPDQRTLLFEAVSRMTELAGAVAAKQNTRRAAFVITDGEDIAKGKATKDEALRMLRQKSIPVYGFVTESTKRDSVNAFGEFCRTSGGYLTILERRKEEEGFLQVQDHLLNSYEAVFLADSNLVSHGTVSAALELAGENNKQQIELLQDRWIVDTAAPIVEELSWESPTQLKVVFSEPVSGADASENFRLERLETGDASQNTDTSQNAEIEDTGNADRIPVFASVGSDKTSTVLSFSDAPESGIYRLVCSRIRDVSMEENPLEGDICVDVEEPQAFAEVPGEQPKTFLKPFLFGAIVVAALVLVGAVSVILRKKKRSAANEQGLETNAGHVSLPCGREVRHHVSVEQKCPEEKQVRFHVKGQKEELQVTIRRSMIVGRSSACELIFDDPALSRQHFVLELKEGEVWIRNLSQSGFTKVNKSRLGEGQYRLKSGDEIGAGQLEMTIRWN